MTLATEASSSAGEVAMEPIMVGLVPESVLMNEQDWDRVIGMGRNERVEVAVS